MKLQQVEALAKNLSKIYLVDDATNLKDLPINEEQLAYVQSKIEQQIPSVVLNDLGKLTIILHFQLVEDNLSKSQENCRLAGLIAVKTLNAHKVESVGIIDNSTLDQANLLLAEGMMLSNYQFLKYKKDIETLKNSLNNIQLLQAQTSESAIRELQNIVDAVIIARDLINEPLSYLTAEQLSEETRKCSEKAGFNLTIHNKEWITEQGLNGLLAVNRGSVDPPTFNILEWKPDNAVNKKPIILVGKGIVYDTGGLSLKPTSGMDHMKCDMGGAAAVIGSFYALASNKLPLYVIGIIPATDNRPGLNAYAPGDVIHMHSGATVEVLNTDAEGRMILADGLSYAKSYDPAYVIDIATLTGSALVAVGQQGMLLFSKLPEKAKENILAASFNVYERLVELPLWEEYKDALKSDIADLKNVGGRFGGAILAAKFLEHFVDFPWAHIDMAPMGWNYKPNGYRLKNGSGAGVRLLYDLFKKEANNWTHE